MKDGGWTSRGRRAHKERTKKRRKTDKNKEQRTKKIEGWKNEEMNVEDENEQRRQKQRMKNRPTGRPTDRPADRLAGRPTDRPTICWFSEICFFFGFKQLKIKNKNGEIVFLMGGGVRVAPTTDDRPPTTRCWGPSDLTSLWWWFVLMICPYTLPINF